MKEEKDKGLFLKKRREWKTAKPETIIDYLRVVKRVKHEEFEHAQSSE